MYNFSQKKLHKFDRKTAFHQISFHGESSENQDLDDFLVETLAWINYRRR